MDLRSLLTDNRRHSLPWNFINDCKSSLNLVSSVLSHNLSARSYGGVKRPTFSRLDSTGNELEMNGDNMEFGGEGGSGTDTDCVGSGTNCGHDYDKMAKSKPRSIFQFISGFIGTKVLNVSRNQCMADNRPVLNIGGIFEMYQESCAVEDSLKSSAGTTSHNSKSSVDAHRRRCHSCTELSAPSFQCVPQIPTTTTPAKVTSEKEKLVPSNQEDLAPTETEVTMPSSDLAREHQPRNDSISKGSSRNLRRKCRPPATQACSELKGPLQFTLNKLNSSKNGVKLTNNNTELNKCPFTNCNPPTGEHSHSPKNGHVTNPMFINGQIYDGNCVNKVVASKSSKRRQREKRRKRRQKKQQLSMPTKPEEVCDRSSTVLEEQRKIEVPVCSNATIAFILDTACFISESSNEEETTIDWDCDSDDEWDQSDVLWASFQCTQLKVSPHYESVADSSASSHDEVDAAVSSCSPQLATAEYPTACHVTGEELRRINERWNREEVIPVKNGTKHKKVHFPVDGLTRVRRLHTWTFAHQEARKGKWEELARDRARFQTRICEAEKVIRPVLCPQHRRRVFQKYFAAEEKGLPFIWIRLN